MSIGTYTVTADADDLEGWTARDLAEALEAPLAVMGIEVICEPGQIGGGGLALHSEHYIEEVVRRIVEQVIEGGHESQTVHAVVMPFGNSAHVIVPKRFIGQTIGYKLR